MNYMIKTLKMFEFGSWEDATSSTSKMPQDNGMGRLGREGRHWKKHSSDADWWRAMSNQSMKAPETTCSRRCHRCKRRRLCSHSLQGVREKRRAQGHDKMKVMFVDVKKAHLNAKCDEEEWVELPDDFFSKKFGGTPS